MQLQHSTAEAAVPEVSDLDSARLEQLTAAREADRLWRAGRKAELDRLIQRALGLVFFTGFVLAVAAYWTVRALVPQTSRQDAFWPWVVWDLCGIFLPPAILWLVGRVAGKQLRPLFDERRAYEEKPGDPVVWSSGLVIYPPAVVEAGVPVQPADLPADAVVWSTGTVIYTPRSSEKA